MKTRFWMLVVALAAIGGISAGVVFGSDSSTSVIRASADAPVRATHEVSAPSGKAVVAKRRHRANIKYRETTGFTIDPGGTVGSTLKCPLHYKALNGYYGADVHADTKGVVPLYNALGGSAGPNPRKWTAFLLNEDTASRNAFLGIVCLKP